MKILFIFWRMSAALITFSFFSLACMKDPTSVMKSEENRGETNEKLSFWQTKRIGANGFNEPEPNNESAFTNEWFASAKDHGIQFIRLTTSKMIPSAGHRDFLIGNTEDYKGIPLADLALLKVILDRAHEHGLKIWFVPLSLPGARWAQQNGGRRDFRIWQEPRWQKQAMAFWGDLVREIKDHPAIVAYSFLNEPFPELTPRITPTSPADPIEDNSLEADFATWYKKAEGSLEDLNLFYSNMIKAVREIDPQTPIILESGLYATPTATPFLKVQNDPAVLYSFHQYEPFLYTSAQQRRKTDYTYPGEIPLSPAPESQKRYWDKEALRTYLSPIEEWRVEKGLKSWQIVVGELGVNRRVKGAESYLKDNISLFDEWGWSWAFYSFRENWDGMDYELGQGKLPWKYWEAIEKGEPFELPRSTNNPLYLPIKESLEKHLGRELP